MLKKTLFITLILFTTNVLAEWVDVNESDDAHVFVESSIRSQGDIVKVWEYDNYKKPEKGIMSARFLIELDCKNELYHPLYMSAFKGPNLSGEATEVDLSKKTSWAKIPMKDLDVLATYSFGCSQKPSIANLQLIGKSIDTSFSIDMNSIITKGNISTFVQYTDFVKPYLDGTSLSSLSAKNVKEIDCKKHTRKTKHVTFYRGVGGTGDATLFRLMDKSMEPVNLNENLLASYEFELACPK